jgi:hypothetical protein
LLIVIDDVIGVKAETELFEEMMLLIESVVVERAANVFFVAFGGLHGGSYFEILLIF